MLRTGSGCAGGGGWDVKVQLVGLDFVLGAMKTF